MKKEEIHLGDIRRILFGEAPPEFLLEVFIRTLIIYLFLLIIMRWLGKRMKGQINIFEIAITLTLGAIVSVPMQAPDKGLLQGFIIMLCPVIFQRFSSFLDFKNRHFENITQGKVMVLIKDGVLELGTLRKTRITRQQIFAVLRGQKMNNLSQVERLYLEANGSFSIYRTKGDNRPGLSVLPPSDDALLHSQKRAGDGIRACCVCGRVEYEPEENNCANCHHDKFIPAIL